MKNSKRKNDFVDDPEIEPCPFCRRAAHQTRNVVEDPKNRRYWITCAQTRCHATGPKRKTAAGAIEAWNKAHPRTTTEARSGNT